MDELIYNKIVVFLLKYFSFNTENIVQALFSVYLYSHSHDYIMLGWKLQEQIPVTKHYIGCHEYHNIFLEKVNDSCLLRSFQTDLREDETLNKSFIIKHEIGNIESGIWRKNEQL